MKARIKKTPIFRKLMSLKKSAKEQSNRHIANMADSSGNPKSCLENFLGEVSKKSATKQVLIGAASGWLTGFITVRFGKAVSLAAGGGIVLLHYANEKGYIDINWDKVNRKLDKVADKIEEKVTGEGPSWSDKAERFIDRKLDKAEKSIRKQQSKAKRWYSGLVGEESNLQLTDAQIFIVSFVAGLALGMATSK